MSVAFFIPALLIGGVGCGATTELIKVPFELTSEVTSSTTPGATAFNGHAKSRQKLERFVAHSYDHVSADIARGNGEYLVSLASLAGVPAASLIAFEDDMQSNYASFVDPAHDEGWVRVVNRAWSAGYGATPGEH